jgi:hypothetical protein
MNILSTLSGEVIANAGKQLPPAELATSETMHVVIDLPNSQKARVTFTRKRHKRGRHVHWFWTATYAEHID